MTRATSLAAYESVKPHLNRLQKEVLELVKSQGGATSDELEGLMGLNHQTVSPRLWELARLGWIEDGGRRRPTRSGRNAIVWETA